MNKETRGILYGMATGDGCISIGKAQSSKTASLHIGHSPKQRAYLEWKRKLLHSKLGGKEPSLYEYQSKNSKTGKTYTNLQVYKSHKYFRQMHRVLYPYGKFLYTEKLLSYLTDAGVAIWYCDDGSGTVHYNNRNGEKKIGGCSTRIATYCSLPEIELISEWFQDWGLTVKKDLDKRNGLYSVRLATQDSHKFINRIQEYVPQCMKYKVEHTGLILPRVLDTPKRCDDIV